MVHDISYFRKKYSRLGDQKLLITQLYDGQVDLVCASKNQLHTFIRLTQMKIIVL